MKKPKSSAKSLFSKLFRRKHWNNKEAGEDVIDYEEGCDWVEEEPHVLLPLPVSIVNARGPLRISSETCQPNKSSSSFSNNIEDEEEEVKISPECIVCLEEVKYPNTTKCWMRTIWNSCGVRLKKCPYRCSSDKKFILKHHKNRCKLLLIMCICRHPNLF